MNVITANTADNISKGIFSIINSAADIFRGDSAFGVKGLMLSSHLTRSRGQ